MKRKILWPPLFQMLLFCGFFLLLAAASLYASDPTILEKSLVKAAVRCHIEKHMPWPKGAVRVFFPSDLKEMVLPSRNFKLEVKENKNDEYIGHKLYRVNVRHKDHDYKQIFVPVRIEVFMEVALSAKLLRKGETVSAQDIALSEKWFSRLPKDLIDDPQTVIGRRMLRSVNAQTPLTSSMIGDPVMFKKGKIVKIVCIHDTLNISTLGVAEEEGIFGTTVKVRNISSNKVIHGRVIGDSIVKVDI